MKPAWNKMRNPFAWTKAEEGLLPPLDLLGVWEGVSDGVKHEVSKTRDA